MENSGFSSLDLIRQRIEKLEKQDIAVETYGSDFDADKELVENKSETSQGVDEFESITRELHETYKSKNDDYGNAFDDALNENNLGLTYAAGLIFNKTKRFVNLHKHYEICRINESIDDTLLDLANYCILTVMWLRKHKI